MSQSSPFTVDSADWGQVVRCGQQVTFYPLSYFASTDAHFNRLGNSILFSVLYENNFDHIKVGHTSFINLIKNNFILFTIY